VKVGIAMTLKHNLIVGAKAFTGNPYDGHTLMQDTGIKPTTAYVDLGYRGVDADNPGVAIKHRGKFKTLSAQDRKRLKRRQAIEPIIGHLKTDHRMERCHLSLFVPVSCHHNRAKRASLAARARLYLVQQVSAAPVGRLKRINQDRPIIKPLL
jgi:hypothetical protein